MSPIPTKGFYDQESTDSVKHHEERSAQIRAAAKAQEEEVNKAEAERVAAIQRREQTLREAEAERLEVQAGLVRDGETREMLLERIRKLREVKEVEPVYIGRNPELQAQFEKEQADGRAAVAKAEAEETRMRTLRAKLEEEDRKRVGASERVFIPNEMEPKATPDMKRLKK